MSGADGHHEGTGEQTAIAVDNGAPPRRRGRGRRRAVLAVGIVLAVSLLGLVGTNMVVLRALDGASYDDVELVPRRTVAIVFGALVDADGKPSRALQDRIDGAVALFRSGRVSRLLLTGDNSRVDYDEVTAMRDSAVAAGVPPEAITRDYAGFNTYDSCARAAQVFGVRDAVVVTQDYHLGRALFLCREQGIDSVGLAIPDWQHHPERLSAWYTREQEVSYTVREWFARSKDWANAEVVHPEPTLGGPFVGLTPT